MVKRVCKVVARRAPLALLAFLCFAWSPAPAARGSASGLRGGGTGSGASALRARSLPVDRWLVSDPFAVQEGTPAAEALAAYRLEVEGRPDFFPDRDVELAGTYWHLVRNDSVATLDLDDVFPDRPALAVAYAHAYLRSPSERTVRLRWRGPTCGETRMRLNSARLAPIETEGPPEGAEGRGEPEPEIAARAMAVRLAAGWNTLLAEIAGGDCPFRLEVHLEEAETLADAEDEERSGDLEGLRVQASRPPGVRPTFARPFVTAGEPVAAAPLRWRAGQDDLLADLRLELTPWGAPAAAVAAGAAAEDAEEEGQGRRPRPPGARPGRPPAAGPDPEGDRLAELRRRLLPAPPPALPAPATAELEVEVAGRSVDRIVELGEPGRAVAVSLPFPVPRLRRAAGSAGIEIRLRWRVEGDDRRLRGRLALAEDALLDPTRGPIELDGWTAGEGGRWEGEWRVPESLSGRSLQLLTGAAPGRYAIDGTRAPANPDGRIRLCAPCPGGARIGLTVETVGDRPGEPRVRVAVESGPEDG